MAIKQLKASGFQFRRTVHLSFVPDEEIGGVDGMSKFVTSDEFSRLRIAFALDEGIVTPFDSILLFNGERSPCCTRSLTSTNRPAS
jgi:aminoacylase